MNRSSGIYLVLISLWLMACGEAAPLPGESASPRPATTTIEYRIPKGKHESSRMYRPMTVASLAFQARFDSSAIYSTQHPQNQADINKLMGLADCGSHHHSNSARFGWRWYEGALQVFAYCYTNGGRTSKHLGTASIGKYHAYSIRFEESAYVFSFDELEVSLPRACGSLAQGYKLYPYFGGDEPAPQDITIWILAED